MLNILVVDDQKLVLAVITDFLEHLGYRCVTASDGSEALDALNSDLPIDAVVTDVIMYELSGLDVCHAARRRDPNMPVVFVTGYIPEHVLPSIRQDQHTAIVNKPFSSEELDFAIKRVLPPPSSEAR